MDPLAPLPSWAAPNVPTSTRKPPNSGSLRGSYDQDTYIDKSARQQADFAAGKREIVRAADQIAKAVVDAHGRVNKQGDSFDAWFWPFRQRPTYKIALQEPPRQRRRR